ncbi:Paratox [Streptococcus suis]|uniref:competence regulator inhibitor paratox n=2 Tax=Streptococcus suis TaxID=1307 RepID=UPI001EE70B45|nr:Paratox [Streptococcus suis]
MLEYEELKQAVDDGDITGSTVNIVRRDGKIFDYVLPGEEVRPWEVVSEEKVVDVMRELLYRPKSAPKVCKTRLIKVKKIALN